MKTKYKRKAFLGLIGAFFFLLVGAGPGFCGWVDRLEDWSRSFHEFEETFMDSSGYWVAKNIGGRIVPLFWWEKYLGDVNPIGKAFIPIEEQIPGLDIRGKLELVTRFPLHGNSYEDKFPTFDQFNPRTGKLVPCPNGTLCGKGIRGAGNAPTPPRAGASLEDQWAYLRDLKEWKNTLGEAHADLGLKEASWVQTLEFDYRPVPWLRFDTIFTYRYDAAFDWDDQYAKLYTIDDRKDNQSQGYRSLKYIWREAFVTFYKTPWEITLGKHNVAWGKMFTKVMDFVGPDFFGVAIDEEGRQSLWMANFTYWWKDWHFQYLFIPDWEERIDNDTEPQSRISTSGGRRPLPFRAPGAPGDRRIPADLSIGDVRFDKPGNSWGDFQHAFRFGFEKGKWEFDMAYYYAWITDSLMAGGRLSTPRWRRVLGLGRDDRGRLRTLIARERKPTRIHFIALSAVRPFYKMYRDWIVRFEGVIVKDYPWATRTERFIVGNNGERFDPDGRQKKDMLNLALEVSTVVMRDFSVSMTNVVSMVNPYDSTLADNSPRVISKRHNMEHTLEFSIRKSFWEGKISSSFRWITSTNQGDGQFVQGLDYDISEYLSIGLSARQWYGAGKPLDGSGQHNAEDWWRVTLTYGF